MHEGRYKRPRQQKAIRARVKLPAGMARELCKTIPHKFTQLARNPANSADSMMSTVLGGANFVLHAAGWLEAGLSTGYEKLVQDADRLGAYQVMLAGLPIDDNAMARGAYEEVAPSGHFLGCAHTMANYETAYYDAKLSDSESVEQWQEQGSKDSARRAYERWNQLLNDYEAPPMDPAVDQSLKEFVAKRKSEIPDAWY